MQNSDTPHMIGITVRTYEGPTSALLSYLISDVIEDPVFVFLGDVAIHHNTSAICTFD